MKIFTITELTLAIKELIEGAFGYNNFWVEGEISNFKGKNLSGHMYFSVKDEKAILPCVIFRGVSSKLSIEINDGMKVLALGRINLYEPHGRYQFVIEEIKPAGLGDLHIKFEMLKKKLLPLFAPDHKKALPEFPAKIGVITSPTGAVIRDIINGISNRYHFVEIILNPVHVQGENAKFEIVQAINELNKPQYEIDVIILARGGGSIEDLWAFNEEMVAQAIFESKIPIVSAVGHMTDYTIADFVADVRASTPSNAAELVVPDKEGILGQIEHLVESIYKTGEHFLSLKDEQLNSLKESFIFRKPQTLLDRFYQQLEDVAERLYSSIKDLVENKKIRLQELAAVIKNLNPKNVLERGYSITQKDGEIIKNTTQVNLQDKLDVFFAKGSINCEVLKKK